MNIDDFDNDIFEYNEEQYRDELISVVYDVYEKACYLDVLPIQVERLMNKYLTNWEDDQDEVEGFFSGTPTEAIEDLYDALKNLFEAHIDEVPYKLIQIFKDYASGK